MGESLATPSEVRRRILEAPVSETITLGDWKIKGFPTQAALATTLLTGCRAKEIVNTVAPDEARTGIAYGVNGCKKVDDIIEDYEGNEYLIIKVTVLKKKLLMESTRVVAVPRSPEYEPLAPILEDAFIHAGDAPVFPYTRQTLSEAARATFTGLSYYIHPYLYFNPDKRREHKEKLAQLKDTDPAAYINEAESVKLIGEERRGHPRPMAAHALRHIREQELEDTFHLEDRQLQTYFKWSNTYMNVPESMGRYRSQRDWRTYAEKLLKRV